MDSSTTNGSADRVYIAKNLETNKNPKLSELKSSNMTLSGEDDSSLVSEATHNLLEFAMTKGHTVNTVTQMTKLQLAEFLRDFYGKVKLKNEELLTLKDLRAGLHKFFLSEAHVDILNDRAFELANTTFDLALKANRRSCHRMRIEMEDLRKIYLSEAMDTNNPESLQNKVFFDISLYICNKGKEHFRNMKKTDFDVVTDSQGRKSVVLKNRDDDKRGSEAEPPTYIGERMYQRPGDPRCPLSSFLKYITHLHPMTDAFWQRPKRDISQSDYVWYDHAALGSSTLTKIMQRISTQAGLSDNYTNYSIRTACIPLVEAVCEEAMRMENSGYPPPANQTTPINVVKPSLLPLGLSHSMSEEMSSDECMSQISEPRGAKDEAMDASGPSYLSRKASSLRSTDSSSLDIDEDMCDLMQAKSQVLNLIRGLKVNDIQKFVDWLKTIRIQYNCGELIVLCTPVEKSNVDLIPDDYVVDRNSYSTRTSTPTSLASDSHIKKSSSLDLSDKRQRLRKENSIKGDNFSDFKSFPHQVSTEYLETAAVKQVEFDHVAGVHCSTSVVGPVKITVPNQDTVLLSGIPENVQLMLHKKSSPLVSSIQTQRQESLATRIFSSENDMDISEIVNLMSNCSTKSKTASNSSSPVPIYNPHSNSPIINNPFPPCESQPSPNKTLYHGMPTPHQVYTKPPPNPPMISLTVPPAHNVLSSNSLLARDHFREFRNKSMGCLSEPNPAMAEGMALKRGSSTGTPILKRQAHIDSGAMYPENLSVKKMCEESLQATNLSLKQHPPKKIESAEEKKATAERLTNTLNYHQEILNNSPLVKRPGERNFSGFRHCYANMVSNSVKAEPQDTSYS